MNNRVKVLRVERGWSQVELAEWKLKRDTDRTLPTGCRAKCLKSLARPTGLEPVFSP